MGVYIEGLKMPKNAPLKIWLLQDGNARIQTNSGKLVHFKAVEVKAPHGRLIEASEITDQILSVCDDYSGADIIKLVENAPTVLEAEEKDNG